MRDAINYIPLLTTVTAFWFGVIVLRRYRERGGMHLLWWGIGLLTYGVGAGTEALTTLTGWHEGVFRAWYITGALLGGAPLGQGTAYLLLSKRTADRLSVALVAVVVIASLFVIAAPIDYSRVQDHHLTGRVFEWQQVRLVSPLVNLYALAFLVGGAVLSAVRASRDATQRHRVTGNVCIALGGILPGIGGSFTRFGHTEVLYVTELLGLILIYTGYRVIAYAKRDARDAQVSAASIALVR